MAYICQIQKKLYVHVMSIKGLGTKIVGDWWVRAHILIFPLQELCIYTTNSISVKIDLWNRTNLMIWCDSDAYEYSEQTDHGHDGRPAEGS